VLNNDFDSVCELITLYVLKNLNVGNTGSNGKIAKLVVNNLKHNLGKKTSQEMKVLQSILCRRFEDLEKE